mmetsp:Transcript_111519/g.359952  ORF Transcript_111519/g.359952 Transcript_111519/m.359952 type:complete len:284 (+) Transcript_111519:761-1612(+)
MQLDRRALRQVLQARCQGRWRQRWCCGQLGPQRCQVWCRARGRQLGTFRPRCPFAAAWSSASFAPKPSDDVAGRSSSHGARRSCGSCAATGRCQLGGRSNWGRGLPVLNHRVVPRQKGRSCQRAGTRGRLRVQDLRARLGSPRGRRRHPQARAALAGDDPGGQGAPAAGGELLLQRRRLAGAPGLGQGARIRGAQSRDVGGLEDLRGLRRHLQARAALAGDDPGSQGAPAGGGEFILQRHRPGRRRAGARDLGQDAKIWEAPSRDVGGLEDMWGGIAEDAHLP